MKGGATDIVRLLGIDHAISDYIFLHTASFWGSTHFQRCSQRSRRGATLLSATQRESWMKRGAGRALTFWMFRTIYRLMSGATYEPIPSAFRPFERAAAFHIASRSNGEVL